MLKIISHLWNANWNHNEIPYTSTRMTEFKSDNTKSWWACKANGTLILLVIKQNGTAMLENILAVPYKFIYMFNIWPSHYTSRYYPRATKTYTFEDLNENSLLALFLLAQAENKSNTHQVN